MTRKISIGLVIACFAIMTLWDIYPTLTPEKGDTISEATRDIGAVCYTLAFVWGILPGHFWFNKRDLATRNIPALWVATGLFVARDITQLGTFQGGTPIAFILGIIAGSVWWPQNANPEE